ncbi:MAG: periplasmic heavy metal sensor [Sulfuricella sp.]
MSKKWKFSLVSVAAVFGLGIIFSSSVMANMPRHPGETEFMPMRAIHDKLNLSEAQEKSWQALSQEGQAMRKTLRNEHVEMKSQLKQELDKGEPDFAAAAAKADRLADERTGKMRRMRDEWIKFHATLSPAQQAIVRDEMKAHLSKAEKRWDRMKQRREKFGPN